jgi:hypothetical protein
MWWRSVAKAIVTMLNLDSDGEGIAAGALILQGFWPDSA